MGRRSECVCIARAEFGHGRHSIDDAISRGRRASSGVQVRAFTVQRIAQSPFESVVRVFEIGGRLIRLDDPQRCRMEYPFDYRMIAISHIAVEGSRRWPLKTAEMRVESKGDKQQRTAWETLDSGA